MDANWPEDPRRVFPGTNSVPPDYEVMRYNLKLLSFLGLSRGRRSDLRAVLRVLLCYALMAVPSLLYYLVRSDVEITAYITGILEITFCLVSLANLLSLCVQKQKMWNLLDTINLTWRKRENHLHFPIVLTAERHGNIYTTLYILAMTFIFALSSLLPLATFLVKRFLLGEEDVAVFVIAKLELGIEESACYGLVHFAYYALLLVLNLPYLSATDCARVALCAHVAALFALVRRRLGAVRTEPDLRAAVRLHGAALECAALLEALYATPMLVQFSLSSFKLCLTVWGISIMSSESALWVCLFAGICAAEILSIFVHSYCGQIIINESAAVAKALYSLAWYNTSDTRIKRYLLIISQRCQKPATVTAGKFYVISLEVFAKIIKAAGSYFTFLQSVK